MYVDIHVILPTVFVCWWFLFGSACLHITILMSCMTDMLTSMTCKQKCVTWKKLMNKWRQVVLTKSCPELCSP